MTHMFPFTLTISLQTVVIISRLPDGVTDVSIFSVRPELASWIYFIDFIAYRASQHRAMRIAGLILCRLSRPASQLYVADRLLCSTSPVGI